MSRQLDKTITTITNFRHATDTLDGELQIYVQKTGREDDDSALVETTEVQLVLPKNVDEKSYLVLRSK